MDKGNGDENDAPDERNEQDRNHHQLNSSSNISGSSAPRRRGDEENSQNFLTKSSEFDLNDSAVLTPQMIQDQRIKAMEHEMREMAKHQRQKQQKLRQTSVGEQQPPESLGDVRPYPSQMAKYWDNQFGRASGTSSVGISRNNLAPESSGSISVTDNNDDINPEENRTPMAATPKKENMAIGKKMKDMHATAPNSVPVAPGAFAQVGPGAMNTAGLMDENEENDGSGTEVETTESNLIQASKVDDAQTIVNATDVQRDNFKRQLIVGTIFVFAVALATGLYFGLSSNTGTQCRQDDFCCDPSNVPIGHLAPVSCYCFGTIELIRDDDDDRVDNVYFRQDNFDQAKKYFLEFLQSSDDEMTGTSNKSSFLNETIQELEQMQGNTCHPFDQLLLMFSNNVTFNSYLSTKRAKARNSHIMLASLFITTNGVNWTVNDGWFDAKSEDADEEQVFGDIGFGLCAWYGLECLFADHVSFMNLRENNLNGTLQPVLFMFSRLQQLDLSANYHLTGEIPAAIENLNELTSLAIAATNLSGTIPTELARLSELHELTLGGYEDPCSGFNGEIPAGLFDNPYLRSVFITLNDLQTELPKDVGLATNLQTLSLFANRLTGQVPTTIANLTSLKVLDLSYNLLDSDATIPSEVLLNLTDLEFLNLAYSGLNETIPESFCNDATSTRSKILVGTNCDYQLCTCCQNVTGGNSSNSTEDKLVDVFCVYSNDAWDDYLAYCTKDESDD